MLIPVIRSGFPGVNNNRMAVRLFLLVWVSLLLCTGCRREKPATEGRARFVQVEDSLLMPDSAWQAVEVAARMRKLGLVEITKVDSSVRVELKYATPDNFTGKVLYRSLRQAYLLPEAAAALKRAQQQLRRKKPGWSLVVYDAARPMPVQREMWERVKGTPQRVFVGNPARGGGLHNYGAAVDVSVVDSSGQVLDMGCDFDYFGEEARVDREQRLLKEGKLTAAQLENRLLLRSVMVEAGFKVLPGEWWHFNWMSRQEAVKKLKVIE